MIAEELPWCERDIAWCERDVAWSERDVAWCERDIAMMWAKQWSGGETRDQDVGIGEDWIFSNDCLLGYLCALWNHAGWFQQSRVGIVWCCSPASSGSLVLWFLLLPLPCWATAFVAPRHYAAPLPSLLHIIVLLFLWLCYGAPVERSVCLLRVDLSASEKVHVVFVAAESRKKSCLMYGVRALNQFKNSH